jgi:hypothetical protein
MGRKAKNVEEKKECPSCGLGVSPESAICEFCGWDFQEENEWILQIEKLERELMLEKQKFEPGTVGHMIESTLRTPHLDKSEAPAEANPESAGTQESAQTPSMEEDIAPFEPEEEPPRVEPPVAAEEPVKEVARPEAPKVRRVRSAKVAPQPAEAPAQSASPVRVRRVAAPSAPKTAPVVRKVKEPSQAPQTQEGPAKTRKVRSIRKV